MRGASQNYQIQKWGILHNYKTALEHEDFETAEAIIQANPEVSRDEFTKVYEETFQTPEED